MQTFPPSPQTTKSNFSHCVWSTATLRSQRMITIRHKPSHTLMNTHTQVAAPFTSKNTPAPPAATPPPKSDNVTTPHPFSLIPYLNNPSIYQQTRTKAIHHTQKLTNLRKNRQLGRKGKTQKNHRHGPHAEHERGAAAVQERV